MFFTTIFPNPGQKLKAPGTSVSVKKYESEKTKERRTIPQKNQGTKAVFFAVARFLIYGVLVILSTQIIASDAETDTAIKFSEASKTEWSQTFYLLSAVAVLVLVFFLSQGYEAITLLMGGGMLTLMIREQDYYLDNIYHGAWFPFALAVTAITLFLVLKRRKQLWENIREYIKTPSFGIFVIAAMEIFVFSRLFGKKTVWMDLFDVNQLDIVQRGVKNAAEEGSELFGYTMLFAAMLEFAYYICSKNETTSGKSNQHDSRIRTQK